MKKFIALNALVLALFFAHGSQAADSDTVSAKIAHNSVSFMMDSVMMDGYVLYSCDALESTVTSMLKQMGATPCVSELRRRRGSYDSVLCSKHRREV